MADKQQQSGAWKAIKPYVNGGMSGMLATSIIQPIDMVKVRLQLGEKGSPVSRRRTSISGNSLPAPCPSHGPARV